jgi:hypothetical protein
MRYKAETWQTYSRTTQTKEEIGNPENFALGGPKLGMKSSFASLCKN